MTDANPDPAWTTAPLISDFANDAEMLELLDLFVGEMSGRIHDIDAAIAADDLTELARLAHQLKGAGGGYGFPTITESAATLEQLAKSADDRDALLRGVEELTALCRRASAQPGEAA